MYELRTIFARRIHPLIVSTGFGPLFEQLIMKVFDEAVAEAEADHRRELARAGIIKAA